MTETEKLIEEIKMMLPKVNRAYLEYIHNLLVSMTKDKK